MTTTNISGILVHARPGRINQVETAISELHGTQIHTVTEEGRLIVTVEDEEQQVGNTLLALRNIKGVLSASIVYTETLETSELEKEI